ncbi:hypothetical protein R1sor_002425 [Riccia sorocarpa]|uniref:Uncharacterized protein n=1 Tax=Riccia sorocarpa TaxID=122646 RepID=A0ABD3GZ55_9MARC
MVMVAPDCHLRRMGFGAMDIVGMIWSHPVASVVVALLFTPPLFPVLVFFSPLLISTALVVLAMISMGSTVDDGSSSSGSGADYYNGCKQEWNELKEEMEFLNLRAHSFAIDDEDGPYLDDFDDRRQHKRHKGGAAAVVKSWEETGRAWVDSVLHQEARHKQPRTNSHNYFSSFPSVAFETNREVKFAQPIPQVSLVPFVPSPGTLLADSTGPAPPLGGDDRIPGRSVDTAAQNVLAVQAPSADYRGNERRERFTLLNKGDEKLAMPRAESVGSDSNSSRGQTVVESAEGRTDRGQSQHHQQHPSMSNQSGNGRSGDDVVISRIGSGEHHRTPSVVVATLSEKLNVPLEDIMALLNGEDKPLPSGGGGAARFRKGSDNS